MKTMWTCAAYAIVAALVFVAAPTGAYAKGSQLTKKQMALQAVAELEKMLPGTGIVIAETSEERIQKELDKQHQKARDGGYDKEYHRAIRDNGGERLKEEWKKNCNSKPLNKKELNCY